MSSVTIAEINDLYHRLGLDNEDTIKHFKNLRNMETLGNECQEREIILIETSDNTSIEKQEGNNAELEWDKK